tara:strand:+ start:1195 stop:1428 length:234 start_codon:yes stop_codon:yes gene_type:complete
MRGVTFNQSEQRYNKMKSEAENYIVGMMTKYGITKLDTGKTYTMDAALDRASEMNVTYEAELKVLGGEKFVAVAIYA